MPNQDGNVAFKVIWVYGDAGPFSSPCTPQGRQINIIQDPRVWCGQTNCPCYEIYHHKANKGSYWQYHKNKKDLDQWPCYDSVVFQSWSFGSGIYHHGHKKNEPIPIKHFKAGKLAILTSKPSGALEKDPKIIGCFSNAGMTTHREWGVLPVLNFLAIYGLSEKRPADGRVEMAPGIFPSPQKRCRYSA